MKDATGEATMTIVVIVLIGIIMAVGVPMIRNIMNTQSAKTSCMNLGMSYDGNSNQCVNY